MPRGNNKDDILQGTLDVMVLKTLDIMGPQHGFGLARRIRQVSGDTLDLNPGTLYPALLRLEQKHWVKTEWITTENNRRAKYYQLTTAGQRQIIEKVDSWKRTVALMERFLDFTKE